MGLGSLRRAMDLSSSSFFFVLVRFLFHFHFHPPLNPPPRRYSTYHPEFIILGWRLQSRFEHVGNHVEYDFERVQAANSNAWSGGPKHLGMGPGKEGCSSEGFEGDSEL